MATKKKVTEEDLAIIDEGTEQAVWNVLDFPDGFKGIIESSQVLLQFRKTS